ncbi:MAG: MFS transporter [Candidatus Cloacimonadaceae bacterium]|nr:MFS transporter [Candidatus Cloacimonadaceae bacterium]
MNKYISTCACFVVMLCLGGVYAWSVFAHELRISVGFTNAQAQLIFGTLICVFPVSMIFVAKLAEKLSPRQLITISALFYSCGYIIAGFSQGSFLLVLMGIGVLGGIGTGFGYLVSITTPARWFPEKSGSITGIVTAGFGFAALILSYFANKLLLQGYHVLEIFKVLGVVYGLLLLTMSFMVKSPDSISLSDKVKFRNLINNKAFYKLLIGIFLGTFAGLLIIGNLRSIGAVHNVPNNTLIMGVSILAIANFLGRISWGGISDHLGANLTIFFSLALQGIAIYLLNYVAITSETYLMLSLLVGFGFGGNFVLFAKKTAKVFGMDNLLAVYPYVFVGYAIGGIFGPATGGYLYDMYGNFDAAIYLAAFASMAGAAIFVFSRKQKVN